MTESHLAKGRLAAVGAALLWSTGGLAIKLAPLPALGVAFWRSLVSAVFLVLVLRPGLDRWKRVSWTSAVLYAGTILSFVAATKMTTAANAIFLQYTGPIYVLVLAPRLLGEPFRRIDAAALAVALGGMALLFVGHVERGALRGDLIAVLSGAFFGGMILSLRREASADPVVSVLAGNALAALVGLPFAGRYLSLDGKALGLVLYLGIVQLGLGYVLFVKAIRAVPAIEVSLWGMLEPVLNPVWVFLGIGERPSPWALVGGFIVLAAVTGRTVLLSRFERRRLAA